jgi:hypothetical protein
MTDFDKLIPELSSWNNGKGINAYAWINSIGNYEHAIGYSTLFWPDFIEFEDCVFQAEPFNEITVRNCLKQTSGNKQATEKVINHLHLYYLFPNINEPTVEQVIYLAELLKQIWECKLQRDFPARRFTVDIFDDSDLQITFWQPRDR